MELKTILTDNYNCPNCKEVMIKSFDRMYHCKNCGKSFRLIKKWERLRFVLSVLVYLFEAFLIIYLRDVVQTPVIINLFIVLVTLLPLFVGIKKLTRDHLEEVREEKK